MKLSTLIQNIEIQPPNSLPDIPIHDVVYDSRKVKQGSLFVAISGFKVDGYQFIPDAIRRGASAIVCEKSFSSDIPVFVVPDTRKALAQISAQFFHHPSQTMPVIGVTGTNGKTTVTYLIEWFLKSAGRSPAVLGTVNYRHGQKIYPSDHTTPESCELQKFLKEVKEESCDSVVMEVSSHALDLHRVDKIDFDIAVFTNLTPEHLDYHKNMEEYFQAKKILFQKLLPQSSKKNRAAIVNIDDPYGQQLFSELSLKTYSYSLSNNSNADFYPLHSQLSVEGITAEIQTPWGGLHLKSPLLGAFNLSNLLAAIAAAETLGVSLKTLEEAIAHFKNVPGRLERVPNSKGIHVFVDYAHTPDALKNVLDALRNLLKSSPLPSRERARERGKIITVFGCGGDRDRSKRPLMGQEVAKFSDYAIVTSDNPRTENPMTIIQEIIPGFQKEGWKERENFSIEIDREKAIHQALELAQPGDIVLIAGKGHEDYQIIGTTKTHFDDREVVRQMQ